MMKVCIFSNDAPAVFQSSINAFIADKKVIDIIKKVLFQGHEFDREHMAKELGDIAWYLAVSADAIGYDLETIFQMNVDKLKARYPDGFDSEHSQHRSSDDI